MKFLAPASSFSRSASAFAVAVCLLNCSAAYAQSADPATDAGEPAGDEIVVTGIRASLDRSIDIKRNSNGVVDAISAEDIGKFPDTNLAESLQRITGVSIDRVNGEGSQITIRGFGGSYNLITLNGRTLPTANIATTGGDQGSDYAQGFSRSFDFSNLASEGVSTLSVYKTGRAAIASGGIGASVNIETRRPIGTEGFDGTLSVKGLFDPSARKDKITPELSGLLTWGNSTGTVGIGLFGSYQKRNSGTPSATVQGWNILKYSEFITNGNLTTPTTRVTNAPTDPNQLIGIPNDSRYHYSETSRERINGQAVLQIQPVDALTLTWDATFYQNSNTEQRSDQTNWFNRPFRSVTFDQNQAVATAVFLEDTISGNKDGGFEQQLRQARDKMYSYGFNAKLEASDTLNFNFDGHISRATSGPPGRNGVSSTLFAIAHKGIRGQTLDLSSGFPVQSITFSDAPTVSGGVTTINGNNNGQLDVGDLGTQVARTTTSRQKQLVKEARFEGAWNFGDDDRFDFGVGYRDSQMNQSYSSTYSPIGDWGVSAVGDIARVAPGIIEPFCVVCQFNRYNPGTSGFSNIAFRGNAADLYSAFGLTNSSSNEIRANIVEEKILSAFGQVSFKQDIAGLPATLVAGLRYEKTKSNSTSPIVLPQAIIWTADNDFNQTISANVTTITGSGRYDNFLPSIDFSIEPMENLVARASFSKTLARAEYNDLFASAQAQAPNRPTVAGGIPSGSSGNPQLRPLISTNIDLSLEWYFAPSSYVSVGYFNKNVKNFVGTGIVTENLFGLRDPSSGAPGTRSGAARDALNSIGAGLSEVNLFTMTALIQTTGSPAAAIAQFQANSTAGVLNQGFVDSTLAAVDIVPNASDPLFQFQVVKPLNNKKGKIHGFEIAGQYFLGDTGLGIAGSYTKVDGNVNVDVTSPPGTNVFALVGLSDTANATLIYEKYGISGRLAYNWRDKYLAGVNRDSYNNPTFVAARSQLDLNISYDFNDRFAVSVEGINLTRKGTRTYARSEKQLWFAQELDARYMIGARYKF